MSGESPSTKPETGLEIEADTRYYGRQRLRDLLFRRIEPNGNQTWKETYEAAMQRIGAKSFEEFVIVDPDTGEIRQRNARELVEKFGDSVLEVMDPQTGDRKKVTLKDLDAQIQNGVGVKKDLGLWSAKQSRERTFGLRGARTDLSAIFAQPADPDFYVREFKRDHKTILSHANDPWDLFKKILDSQEIDRDSKLELWQRRWGEYARSIAEIQAKVDRGEIAEFGPEYKRLILDPYNESTKRMAEGEVIEMLHWNAVITDKPKGKPLYTKEQQKDGRIRIIAGGNGEAVTFEDLRHTVAMWQGSSSIQFVKGVDTFGADEGRDLRAWKRTPVTNLRDQWAGIQIILGEEHNRNTLPMIAGTGDYESIPRAQAWAQAEANAMRKILENRATTPEERSEARDRLKLAEMILEGNLLDKIKGANGKLLSQMSPENRDAEMRKARADLTALTLNYQKMTPEMIRRANIERAKLIKSGDLYYLANKLILIEGGYPEDANDPTGIPGWFKGKTEQEVEGILHRRDLWSPPIVYGMGLSHFLQLLESKHDPQEKEALFESVLMHKNRTFINAIVVNEAVSRKITWPDPIRLGQIQHERDRYFPGEEKLPDDPFAKLLRKE